MTDKEKKSKIADILMDFQEEYSNEVINRPMLASLYAGNILSFIDSLQEEPVSDELEKVVEEIVDPTVLNAYGVKEIANRLRRTMIEPVSEELGDYINELSKQFPEVSFAKLSRIAVRVAKWQKQQIKKAMDLGEPPYLINIEQAYYRTLKLLEE